MTFPYATSILSLPSTKEALRADRCASNARFDSLASLGLDQNFELTVHSSLSLFLAPL
ncbi:656_t:CDS:2 [Paraglomus brasilianum]|uniref:656_t:CDS:1 n=1 Tax=Paraglomus brasilianum TaxID=144538 RepID=A0A9N9AGR8_9GLOM|nr:656_t:CDS:2 [Paraglomus brasilianum]